MIHIERNLLQEWLSFFKIKFSTHEIFSVTKKNAWVWKSNLLALGDIASGEKMHSGLNHVMEKNKEGYGKVKSQDTQAAWVNHWCEVTVSPTACEIHRQQHTCTHMDMHHTLSSFSLSTTWGPSVSVFDQQRSSCTYSSSELTIIVWEFRLDYQ